MISVCVAHCQDQCETKNNNSKLLEQLQQVNFVSFRVRNEK